METRKYKDCFGHDVYETRDSHGTVVGRTTHYIDSFGKDVYETRDSHGNIAGSTTRNKDFFGSDVYKTSGNSSGSAGGTASGLYVIPVFLVLLLLYFLGKASNAFLSNSLIGLLVYTAACGFVSFIWILLFSHDKRTAAKSMVLTFISCLIDILLFFTSDSLSQNPINVMVLYMVLYYILKAIPIITFNIKQSNEEVSRAYTGFSFFTMYIFLLLGTLVSFDFVGQVGFAIFSPLIFVLPGWIIYKLIYKICLLWRR